MALEVAKGIVRLEAGTTPAEELDFRPRALVLWWCRERSAGCAGGIGFATDGGGDASTAWVADDALAPGVLSRWGAEAPLLFHDDPRTPDASFRGHVRFADRGFSVECDREPEHPWLVHYLALGGSDVHSAAVRSLVLDSTGTRAVTGLGFTPGFVLAAVGAGSMAGRAAIGSRGWVRRGRSAEQPGGRRVRLAGRRRRNDCARSSMHRRNRRASRCRSVRRDRSPQPARLVRPRRVHARDHALDLRASARGPRARRGQLHGRPGHCVVAKLRRSASSLPEHSSSAPASTQRRTRATSDACAWAASRAISAPAASRGPPAGAAPGRPSHARVPPPKPSSRS